MRGPAATKRNFITAFNGDAIVHASTHGILNNARSNMNFIAFSQTDSLNKNELLFVDDLYAQPLPTPLLVMTACETSAGNITSEGNISIARGLAYSGVKSYITTLLPARASYNAELFKNFYENILDKQQNKDEALNEAKKAFIERFGYYNPAYWSGFILVGDDRPIDFKQEKKSNYTLTVLGILALLSALGFYFRKTQKET
jgi:LPXTG-motif cell wall-anchored protein